MEQLSQEVLHNLLETTDQTCVSIYLPTYKKGADAQQNPIRFHNLLKQARQQLEKSGLSNHQIKLRLEEAENKLGDEDFWLHQKLGLAVLICESEVRFLRLPLEVKESVQIGTHLHIKPLLPLLTTNGKFFILTLSQNDIKLYEATRTDIDKRFLGDIPRSMEDLFDMDDLRDHLQTHSTSSGGTMMHGQGPGDESVKKDVSQFLNQVENGITDLLRDEQAPLILAGVEYLTSMYKKHNKYKHLMEQSIDGSPAQTTKEKLHEEAWTIIQPYFKQKEADALDKYHAQAGTGKTSSQIEEVVSAAFAGKVETLFVERFKEVWGEYVADKDEVLVHDSRSAKSIDLLDLATATTLKNGGQVYSLKPEEMIKDTSSAAVFRY